MALLRRLVLGDLGDTRASTPACFGPFGWRCLDGLGGFNRITQEVSNETLTELVHCLVPGDSLAYACANKCG